MFFQKVLFLLRVAQYKNKQQNIEIKPQDAWPIKRVS